MKFSKTDLWKSLKEPSEHTCGNCKFIMDTYDNYCEDCHRYHELKQKSLWEDKWKWDEKTK